MRAALEAAEEQLWEAWRYTRSPATRVPVLRAIQGIEDARKAIRQIESEAVAELRREVW